MPRPKTGKKFYSHSFSLTSEQIEWLNKQQNSSELIRKVIDSLMMLGTEIEPKLSLVTIRHKVDFLQRQLTKQEDEKTTYENQHWKEMYSSPHLIDVQRVPIKNKEAKFHRKIVTGYDEAIRSLETEIEKLKEQVLKE
jgi:hypothetical protein